MSFQQSTAMPGSNYAIGVAQALEHSMVDITTTWFLLATPIPANASAFRFQAVNHNVDEASDWYLAPAGAHFTPSNIAANQFTPLVVENTFYPSVRMINDTTYYLAFDTGLLPEPTRGEVLGWLQVRYTTGMLTLLSSGVAYGEPGIVIGSTTVVPEPAGLLALAAVALLGRRQRSAL
ncbi:MAG TPA: hypothetical protein VF595_14350 [Tepidisphaeraceae bacterium]